ncbi:MAG: hypothetical protein EOM80_02690 [Erysipelotrichia bacterium]|nr:hypothetical protein [Erysipelotrichia bacterium]
MNHYKRLRACILFFAAIGFITTLNGCCSRKTVSKKPAVSVTPVFEKTVAKTAIEAPLSDNIVSFTPDNTERALRDQDKKTQVLYQKLENSYEMFRKDNFDGALREVERLQFEISNDPYLEMQSWYLSAMIYHKSGKSSRRKRAMRKMLESMEELQKDPRFRNAFEDGMMSQEVINLAIGKGEGRYVE